MAKKPLDPKAKAKRQKIIAITLAVILLGVLGFQLPRTLKMLNQKAPDVSAAPTTTTPTTTTGTGSVSLSPPTLSGGQGTTSGTTPSSSGGLADSDPAPAPAAGQLVTFDRFQSKDPFVQQVLATAGSSGGTGTGTTTKPAPGGGAPAGTDASTSGSGSGSGAVAAAPAKPTSATISVNGVSETVAVDADFPAASPMFHLVSLTATTAKIAIAGGSYADGAPTVTLTKGRPLTLMNTADGTRYVLRLLATA